jgi:hypothetical protein
LLGFLTSSPGSRDAATSLTRWQQKGRSFFAPNRSTFQGGSLASPTSQLQGKQQYLTILHRITSYILNCHIPLVASQRSTWRDTGATLARHWRDTGATVSTRVLDAISIEEQVGPWLRDSAEGSQNIPNLGTLPWTVMIQVFLVPPLCQQVLDEFN